MDINSVTERIKIAQSQIEEAKKELKVIFKTGVKELLASYPEVDRIDININNYEFNDGSPEYWSLYYEDLIVVFKNGDEFDEFNGFGEKKAVYGPIRQKIVEFFAQFDVDSFYEDVFGDDGDSSVSFRSN